ncbi:glycosyltransferase family 2 protein [Acidisoma silvae]|uniref:Glycosyltransferase family 2 protein n=1 Tax=Acidisoma silvae TaxID=2802396 RepID=A0A963YNU2_9PROT|nr:glycosyltransferase family 2 protein [Acidisoma silvae]MCB8873635.1 glycosyltransferase family 2 protein [Acidisoma silvae]
MQLEAAYRWRLTVFESGRRKVIIVGVVRTLNEDDIIESVLRHHLKLCDRIIVLDDGSNDDTAVIVRSMIEEGLPLDLIEIRCVVFDEGNRNTFLFNRARDHHAADWVIFFDADEFLDMRNAGLSLRAFLQSVPGEVDGVQVRLVNYMDAMTDNEHELVVPARMVWRHTVPHDVHKIMMRAGTGITIRPGNHSADRETGSLTIIQNQDILFAHYPRRSGWHDIYKWVIGRLKITAAGAKETSRGTRTHYIAPFGILLERPEQIIQNEGFFRQTPNERIMSQNPIDYLGGALRYTRVTNYKMKCVSMILKYSYELATEFGKLVDTDQAARKRIDDSLKIEP